MCGPQCLCAHFGNKIMGSKEVSIPFADSMYYLNFSVVTKFPTDYPLLYSLLVFYDLHPQLYLTWIQNESYIHSKCVK
ncbi:hypothetical protein ANAPRD1_00182 [Anaplasma phagocytophilum]|nr:hypothetical protein ANAPRD1_00182 [Anaplasma phagocytophilum]SCV62346.1 hypothetical protein ANAPH1_00198 [Anaplasma phagocytophilum]